MFIAEIGINHNGDLEVAKKLIDVAVESGADVVKFQKRNVDLCVPKEMATSMRKTPWGEMSYRDYKYRLEFGEREYDYINTYCNSVGIKWTASVWDCDSLGFILNYNVPFIKIPSACITDTELLSKINKHGKKVILSTGMSTYQEISAAINQLSNCNVSLLVCNSSYPSKDSELDLKAIELLMESFPNCTIGYSGHENGIIPTIIAASLGAKIIERHITLNKKMWGTDQGSSLEPAELRYLISTVNKVPVWLGDKKIKVYSSEEKVKQKLRRVK